LAGSIGVRAATTAVSQNPSPYATANREALDASQTAALPSTLNYLNSEVEPMVAVDPTDSSHTIGVRQQDPWTDGGNNGEASAFSTDGGGTSSAMVTQPFSACYSLSGYGPSLSYQRASDPWVSIGPGKPASVSSCVPTAADCSTAYSVSLSFNETDAKNSVAAATSATPTRCGTG